MDSCFRGNDGGMERDRSSCRHSPEGLLRITENGHAIRSRGLTENTDSVGKAGDDKVGTGVCFIHHFTQVAFHFADEHGADAGSSSRLDIRQAVTDYPGLREVDIMIGGGLAEEAGFGLAAGADFLVPGDGGFWVVQTIIFGIEVCPAGSELGLHLFPDRSKGFFIEVAFGETGLIGDENNQEAELVESGDGGGDAGKELELGHREGVVDDPGFGVIDQLVDDAVTVKKYSFIHLIGPRF